MLVNGYHKEQYKYDENGLIVEVAYYGKTGNAVNNAYGYSRIVFSYHNDQTIRDRKYYNVAGTVLYHEQYINGSWVEVKNWQKDVTDFADELPMDLGEDMENLVIKSAKIVGSSRVEILMVTPKSKYDMSNSTIETYKEFLDAFTEFFKEELDLPRSVTVKGILKDSKGRDLTSVIK